MSSYLPTLSAMKKEFTRYYNEINSKQPYLAKEDKVLQAIEKMQKVRDDCNASNFEHIQYRIEIDDLLAELLGETIHYYFPDHSLYEWMETTPVKESIMEYFYQKIDQFTASAKTFAIHTKKTNITLNFFSPEQAKELNCTTTDKDDCYIMSALTDGMHYTALLNLLDFKKMDSLDENSNEIKAFRLAMNFLFYLDAFPEYITDGVPKDVKKDNKAKIVRISPKVISSNGDRLIAPHFRSGHFRHLDSDYFVNKKGSVVFISSTMVKGKAKTVLNNNGKDKLYEVV